MTTFSGKLEIKFLPEYCISLFGTLFRLFFELFFEIFLQDFDIRRITVKTLNSGHRVIFSLFFDFSRLKSLRLVSLWLDVKCSFERMLLAHQLFTLIKIAAANPELRPSSCHYCIHMELYSYYYINILIKGC